jgi:hypothetical protein
MANDVVYILPNPGGSSGSAHVIGVGECIEFRLRGASCEVQFSVEPSSTNPPNLPHTDDWVYALPPNPSDPLNSIYQFYFGTPGTITYWVDPGAQGVPGGGHTVIVGSVGLEGR